jgi:methionyl-tRNA synthetase
LHLSDVDRITKISESVNLTALVSGHKFDLIPPLFRKLEDEEIKALSKQFGV